MKRKHFLKTTALGLLACQIPRLTFAESAKKLPNVLILGDSISMGYTKIVQKMLEGKAHVYRPTNAKGKFLNCQGTTLGIQKIDTWLSGKEWDVIHFNFGLHDLKHVDPITGKNSSNSKDPQQANKRAYKKNMLQIVRKLKLTEAKLIFATTTPFPDKPHGPHRRANQPKKYNKIALKIMKKNNIKINNLHDFCLPQLDQLQQPNNVHFTEIGSKALAKQVTSLILKELS